MFFLFRFGGGGRSLAASPPPGCANNLYCMRPSSLHYKILIAGNRKVGWEIYVLCTSGSDSYPYVT